MSIQQKIISLLLLFIVCLTASSGILQWLEAKSLQEEMADSAAVMQENAQKSVEEDVTALTANIASHLLSLESQVDDTMMNAAYTLQQIDAARPVTNEDLVQIAEQTGMADLYITDRSGTFTRSTESASLGLNLFSFDEKYRTVLTDEKAIIREPLKLKQETMEIFKFMVMPRLNGEGVIETAMNADLFEEALEKYIGEGNGIEAIYLMNRDGLVLTETLSANQASKWKKGEKTDNPAVQTAFESGEPQLHFENDRAEMYYPVSENNTANYVLSVHINTAPHFLNASIANETLEDVQQSISASNIQSILTTLFIAALFTCFFIWIIRKMVKPLKEIAVQAEKMAEGDLRAHTLSMTSKDEIGQAAGAFQKMNQNLRQLINQISIHTEQVAASSEQLTANADQMAGASEQIAQTVYRVASATDQQVQSVHDMNRTMEEMADGVQQIANRSEQMSASAGQSLTKSAEGNTSIQTAARQMNSIQDTVQQTASIISGLGERSSQIGKFTQVITQIAAQTNLLALNAAIEAAHAGDQGKGFAVVAQEVRHLAEQSSESAEQIQQLITSTQSEIARSVDSMKKVTKEVAEGIATVHHSGLSFTDIQTAAKEVSHHIEVVAASVKQLTKGTEQVGAVIQLVKRNSEETASGTIQVSSSTEDQLAAMQEISASSASLASMAEELKTLTASFKI